MAWPEVPAGIEADMRKAATVTVTGWAGSTPKEISGDGVPYTSFSVSVAERRFDARTQEWGDGPTEWFRVKAWRELARNVAESIRKGDPVVVTGKLRTEEWQNEEGSHAQFVIEADAVGHDLSLGESRFRRVVHRSGPAEDGGRTERVSTPGADPWASDGEPREEVEGQVLASVPDDASALLGAGEAGDATTP